MPYSVKLPPGSPGPDQDTPSDLLLGLSPISEKPVRPVRTGKGGPQSPVPTLLPMLHQWYAMTAREADGNPPTLREAQALLSEIRRLWDDVGPAFAEAAHRQEAWEYYRETGRCPFCGELGPYHDPERGGETA